jgi:Lrp/AsnC family leucine-responsive transcriptional regulator
VGEIILLKGIDEIDKKILRSLSENPELSQLELSEGLKISQPAISARLHKLKETGVLAYSVGTNIKKSQLFLAKIEIMTTGTEDVISFFDKCPLYLNSFLTSGKYNLTVLLVGENMRSIMSCVDSHMRNDPLIKEMEFNLIVTPIRDFIVPIKPVLDKKETIPCETETCCNNCVLHINNRCLGCPASVHYRGNLL